MDPNAPRASGRNGARTHYVLGGLGVLFVVLAILFIGNLWGNQAPRPVIELVDPAFLETTPWRLTYADLVKAKEDLSDYDCYACHDQKNPPQPHFDANHKIIVPDEHSNIVMRHGTHDRNNLCYNCHNEKNFTTLQVRDGREVGFDNIPLLCGSCHGPTYRDWEAGAHGRTSGYWDRSKGEATRLGCTNCHNPHAPDIPTRAPAPGPRSRRTSGTPKPHAADQPPT